MGGWAASLPSLRALIEVLGERQEITYPWDGFSDFQAGLQIRPTGTLSLAARLAHWNPNRQREGRPPPPLPSPRGASALRGRTGSWPRSPCVLSVFLPIGSERRLAGRGVRHAAAGIPARTTDFHLHFAKHWQEFKCAEWGI